MTVVQAAAFLECSKETIRFAIRHGRLKATRIGIGRRGKLEIDKAELDRWNYLRQGKVDPVSGEYERSFEGDERFGEFCERQRIRIRATEGARLTRILERRSAEGSGNVEIRQAAGTHVTTGRRQDGRAIKS